MIKIEEHSGGFYTEAPGKLYNLSRDASDADSFDGTKLVAPLIDQLWHIAHLPFVHNGTAPDGVIETGLLTDQYAVEFKKMIDSYIRAYDKTSDVKVILQDSLGGSDIGSPDAFPENTYSRNVFTNKIESADGTTLNIESKHTLGGINFTKPNSSLFLRINQDDTTLEFKPFGVVNGLVAKLGTSSMSQKWSEIHGVDVFADSVKIDKIKPKSGFDFNIADSSDNNLIFINTKAGAEKNILMKPTSDVTWRIGDSSSKVHSIDVVTLNADNTLREISNFNTIETLSLDVLKNDGLDESLLGDMITQEDIHEVVQVPVLNEDGSPVVDEDGIPVTEEGQGAVLETKTYLNTSKFEPAMMLTLATKLKEALERIEALENA